MIRLVTVTVSRTTTLKHMLNHYKDKVDEMHIVVYDWEEQSKLSEVQKIVSEFPNAKIVKVVVEELYNWEKVTKLYNEVKSTHPNDWWVISDDDEFHIYPDSLRSIISNCDANGWEMVRGGFIDRIGEDGGGADLMALEELGVPCIGFEPDTQRYFDIHHTAADTFDKINKRELELGAAAIGALIYLLDLYQ